MPLLSVYQHDFENLVSAQKEMGLDSNSGIQGTMRSTVHKVDDLTAKLVVKTQETIEDHVFYVDTISYSVSIVILVIALVFGVIVSRSILMGITQLKDTMNKVADTQDLSLVVNTSSNDEIGEMARVFNNMLGNFRDLITSVNLSVNTVNEATGSLSKNINLANSGVDFQIQ